MTDLTDLTEWLLACIAEDEADARTAQGETTGTAFGDYAAEEVLDLARSEGAPKSGLQHFEGWMPARVLAVCQAHRAIVDLIFENAEVADGEWGCGHTAAQIRAGECSDRGTRAEARETLARLALAYADRPGCREEWKP